jgi:hypothetical protein
MNARRTTFVPQPPDEDLIEHGFLLLQTAFAWASANDLEEVMFK